MHDCPKTTPPTVARLSLLALVVCIGAAALTACQPVNESAGATATRDTYFPIGIGAGTLQLQLALTPAEHQQGLMFREKLAADHGMLFLFQRPKQQGFWMKNTSLPLDIGYLDARGRLLEIHQLFPYDETPVASRSPHILMALETNRGWFDKNDIHPGARLDMAALKAAITERGHSIATYAIED